MVLYMKFFFDQTGNPIYPSYWTFLFVFFGAFDSKPVITAAQQSLGYPLALATLVSAAGLAWSLWRRPPSYLLLVYGFGHSAYSFATFLIVDDWNERRFELPLDFAAILACVFLFRLIPSAWPGLARLWPVVAALAVSAVPVLSVPARS